MPYNQLRELYQDWVSAQEQIGFPDVLMPDFSRWFLTIYMRDFVTAIAAVSEAAKPLQHTVYELERMRQKNQLIGSNPE